jgi:hypothetical protein
LLLLDLPFEPEELDDELAELEDSDFEPPELLELLDDSDDVDDALSLLFEDDFEPLRLSVL